jgi:hypothetical protein
LQQTSFLALETLPLVQGNRLDALAQLEDTVTLAPHDTIATIGGAVLEQRRGGINACGQLEGS